MKPSAEPLTIRISDEQRVSGLLLAPARATTCFVFAHGAGAGMTHAFMTTFATGLPSAEWQLCAINLRTWRTDRSAPTLRNLLMPQCELLRPKCCGGSLGSP